MGVLTEYVKKEADHLRSELSRRKGTLKDWLESIKRLNEQLEAWVAAADGGQRLLEAHPTVMFTRQESLLGFYEVQGLSVTLGGRFNGKSADIVPRARYVTSRIKPPGEELRRADGMIEIKDGVVAVYYLFRLKDEACDRWFMQSVAAWNNDSEYGKVEPLDRDRFEAAILQVLQ